MNFCDEHPSSFAVSNYQYIEVLAGFPVKPYRTGRHRSRSREPVSTSPKGVCSVCFELELLSS